MTNSFVTNAVLIERAVNCWHLHQLISHTTQYLNSWLSDLLQSELKMKLFQVEGGSQLWGPSANDSALFADILLSTRPWMRILYIGYRFQNKVCFKFKVLSEIGEMFCEIITGLSFVQIDVYFSHFCHVSSSNSRSCQLFEAMLVSQTDQKKTKDGASGRDLRKSSNSSRALPGYSPQNSSPPPAYDHAVEAFNDAIPPKFRPQNLSDIRSMNLES